MAPFLTQLLVFVIVSLLFDGCCGITTSASIPNAAYTTTTSAPVAVTASTVAAASTDSTLGTMTGVTTPSLVWTTADAASPASSAAGAETTTFYVATTQPGSIGPDHTNSNTQPDPLGDATTEPATVSTTTVAPSTMIALASTAAPPANPATQAPVVINPYSNLPSRPWQLKASNPVNQQQGQQQQQNALPWLFYGRDFFPFMYLLSNTQQQQNPGQTNNGNLAPLYAYGMDMDIWPWSFFFNQNRNQPQQKNNFGWQQNQQQNNFGWSQSQRTDQQFNSNRRNSNNNLANFLWLGEF